MPFQNGQTNRNRSMKFTYKWQSDSIQKHCINFDVESNLSVNKRLIEIHCEKLARQNVVIENSSSNPGTVGFYHETLLFTKALCEWNEAFTIRCFALVFFARSSLRLLRSLLTFSEHIRKLLNTSRQIDDNDVFCW